MSLDLTGFKLTYDDEFNSFTSSPNGSSGYKTTFYFGGRSLPSNGEQEYYSDSSVGVNPFSLQNGELTITASPGSNPGGLAYNSGLITTEGMFTQTYGYFEIRAELPQGQGMWPAFWLLPADKSWPPEIDALEAFGATNANGEGGATKAHVGAITSDWSTGGGGDWVTMPNGGNMYTGYHTYGVDWEPDFITYYIDGQQVYQVKTPFDANKPMYMLANLAVGGSWPGAPAGETGQMQIDYIRAYSKDATATAIALQTVSSPDGANTSDLHGATTGDGTVPNAGTVVVRVSEDAWNGDAQFTVSVDGVRVGGIYTATAIHGQGWQDISITGSFGSGGNHTVDVTFVNDGWGGSPSTDRNLYVQSVTVNGASATTPTANTAANGSTSNDGSALMAINGTVTYAVTGSGTSDSIFSATSYTLDATAHNLTLTGTAAINGTGNALDNVIIGNAADNVLDGGAGNDTLIGDAGNDTYYVDSDLDVVRELPGQGTDTVYSSHFYVLPSNVENLHLTGSADLWAIGNDTGSTLYGNSGNNSLTAGSGPTTMVGGLGDDIYYVNKLTDVVIENPNEGFDTIFSSVSMSAPANVEALALTGSQNLSLTGGDSFIFLYGNSGANTLTAGSGVAILIGQLGDDVAYINNDSDQVVEAPNQGFDTIYSSVSYTLPNNVEALHLTGTANLWAFGNDSASLLYGNSGNNTLTSGTGAATMYGGLGDDMYYVNKSGDVVVENANEGFDTVFSSVSYTLSPNVEALVLTGTANTSATGNSGDNFLYGNAGNNTLNGGGGNDVLTGGAGADRFVLTAGGGNDIVTDFSHAQGDQIDLTAFHTTFAALSIATSGADSVVTVADQTITLQGVSAASLVAQDFLL